MAVDTTLLKKHGFTPEKLEVVRKSERETGWPAAARVYRLHYEAYSSAIEEPYFWVLHYLRYYGGYPEVDKISDVFAASENSAFFGSTQQRLGAQQDKVSQYLATVGKMVKELFQLVREIRVLDERLSYYKDAMTKSRSSESAEITLKGTWVDMVEQGAKNPASVYGMAREVQFTTLPDLFFSIHPKKQEDVDDTVNEKAGQFNRKVREVLKRKLRAFLAWKEHSYEEMKNRRVFTLKYLRQHFEIIKMYISWVKPYLKNIQRMQLDQRKVDSPDLVTAFESSMIEIELLAYKPGKPHNECIMVHFLYRTRPDMNYSQEYNRGPIHIGRVEMTFRAYAWTDKEIEDYKKYREEEDFQLLGLIDGSVRAAMESLGEELARYLREAGDEEANLTKPEEKEEKKDKPNTILDPFMDIGKGFGELFGAVKKDKSLDKRKTRIEVYKEAQDKSKKADSAVKKMWDIYHHYKKHHAMLSW